MAFQEVKIEDLSFNPFTKIGKEWLLITAGNEESYNTMTASWGGVGVMWGKNVVSVYIRPQRYTKEFVDHNDLFTIAFFGENYRPALAYCGKISGRDGTVAFEEADMIMVCKKQYHQEMRPECFDVKENDARWYPEKDYHTMYMAEIVKVLVKE